MDLPRGSNRPNAVTLVDLSLCETSESSHDGRAEIPQVEIDFALVKCVKTLPPERVDSKGNIFTYDI